MVGDNDSINASTTQCEPFEDILQNVGIQDILMVGKNRIYCGRVCFSHYRAKWIFIASRLRLIFHIPSW